MSTDLRSLLMSRRPAVPVSQRPAARKLVESCWAPLWRVLGAKLPEVLVESLGTLAKDDDPEVAKPAKLVLVRDKRFCAEFEIALKDEFRKAVDEFTVGKPSGPDKAARAEAKDTGGLGSGLSLIGFGDMELKTLVEAAGSRVRNAADDIDTSLRMRLANAVHEPEIRPNDSPFKPAIFFRALHTALVRLDVLKDEAVIQVMPRFDGPLIKPIVEAYTAVDSHLSAHGHANEISRTTVFRNTTAGRSTRLGGGTQGSGLHGGGGGHIGGAHAEQILQALYNRLQLVPVDGAAAGGVMPAAGLPTAGMPMVAPPPGTVMVPTVIPAGLDLNFAIPGMAAGTQGMPTGVPAAMPAGMPVVAPTAGVPAPAGSVVSIPGAPLVIGADLLNAINEIQKLGAMALQAARQGQPAPDAAIETGELRNRLMEKATAQVDKLTIEIVGLLFDRINADRHVPQPIKELLQRLQFPLIKVAVTDPGLFVSADQPARRLMDRIASTSIGWTSEGEANQRYLDEVQRAIHVVLASPDEGVVVFERALADFEAYLQDERTRDDDPVQRAKRALAEAEEREIMAINATIKIRSAFDGVQIESYLREFLLETWVRVLVAVSLRDRDDQTVLRRYMNIVPDLVWSVQPKLSQDERKRLVGTIPPVLGALREGLTVIDWPKERMQEFFAKLMNSHAQAVKALELAHGSPGVPFEPSTMRIKLDGIKLDDITPPPADAPVQVSDEQVRHALAQVAADVNHLPPPDTAATQLGDGANLTDQALDARVAQWKRGDWFSLRLGDVMERVQLKWVSPRRTLYLFMPAENRAGHSLSPESLRAYLRSGDLTPVEAEPLFERAVHDVVSDLQRSSVSVPPA